MSQRNMDAAILAGGKGSRLKPLTESIPKVLLPILDGTLLEHNFNKTEAAGFETIYVAAGYFEEQVGVILEGRKQCQIVKQATQIGTAADGILSLEGIIKRDFLVVHGDHYFSSNPIPDLIANHQPGEVTLLLEAADRSEGLGYGIKCHWNPATKKIRQWADVKAKLIELHQREMVVVDGCMVLPLEIFSVIRDVRKEIGNTSEMRSVLKHAFEHGLLTFSGVETQDWWANVNTLETYGQIMKRILDQKARGKGR